MEYYHYVNIFSTKGLEYILVICFLITFVIFVRRLDIPPGGARGRRSDRRPGRPGDRPVIVVPGQQAPQPPAPGERRDTAARREDDPGGR